MKNQSVKNQKTQSVMVKVNNKNKELETIVKELGFKKKIETACAGYSVWKYETYYNPSIRCRVEYNTMAPTPIVVVYNDISSDIDDTSWSEVNFWGEPKEVENYLIQYKKNLKSYMKYLNEQIDETMVLTNLNPHDENVKFRLSQLWNQKNEYREKFFRRTK
jgi:hypothetical protein